MLASTPDTVVIAPSDDEEDEDRLMITRYFISAVGRPPMESEENDMLRYVRWHPGVIDECIKKAEADALRRERAQVKMIELEARVREVQEERIKLHRAMKKQKKKLEELRAAQAEGKSQAAAVGPPGQRIQAAKRQLRVMRGRLANRDATIQKLQRQILEGALTDPEILELGEELERKNFLLKKWREYATSLEPYVSVRVGTGRGTGKGGEGGRQRQAADDRPASADSGRGSAEPQAGPSSGRSNLGRLDPLTVRSMLAAQNDHDSDDEVTIVGEVAYKPEIKNHDGHEILCRCNCGKKFVVKVKGKAIKTESEEKESKKEN